MQYLPAPIQPTTSYVHEIENDVPKHIQAGDWMRKYYTTHMSKAGMLITMEKLFMLSKKATFEHTELTFLKKKISVALLKASKLKQESEDFI